MDKTAKRLFGSDACILISRVDIAARNFVLPRDDDTPVPKVTTAAKTVRLVKLNCRYFVCQLLSLLFSRNGKTYLPSFFPIQCR